MKDDKKKIQSTDLNDYLSFLEQLHDKFTEKIEKKSHDYGSDFDMFDNFNRASELLCITSEQYLIVLVAKHIMCVNKAIMEGKVLNEDIEDRIFDIINYYQLLLAMRHFEKTKNQEKSLI